MNNFHKGFSLLEVIVAIFITVVGIIGIYSIIGDLSALARDANQRLVAAYIAEEGLEIVRNIRDNNIRAKEQEPCKTTPNQCPWNRYFKDIKDNGPALILDYKSLLTYDATDAPVLVALPSECSIIGDDCYKAIYESTNFQKLKVDNNGLYANDGTGSESPFKRIIIVRDCNPANLSSREINGDNPLFGIRPITDPTACMMLDTIVIWKDRKVRAIRATQEMYNYFREE